MRLLCSERRSCLSAAPVARRRSVGASSAPVSEPGRRLTRDQGRDHVAALELAVAYLVSGAFESGDDPAAAGVDREPAVSDPVREKIRGEPLWPVGARNPGEKARTCENRSPFANPSERA